MESDFHGRPATREEHMPTDEEILAENRRRELETAEAERRAELEKAERDAKSRT